MTPSAGWFPRGPMAGAIEARVGVFGRKGQDELLDGLGRPVVAPTPGNRSIAALEAAFRETADAANYVPRVATESVLKELETCVTESRRPVGLSAAPGMGKSTLLRVLAGRLAGRCRCVFLPYGSLSLRDLCAWALGLAGEVETGDPVEGLRSLARGLHTQGSLLALLVDDASGLRIPVARELAALWAAGRGSIQLVLTSPDDAPGDRVLAALGPDVCTIRLGSRMTIQETGDFVRSRLSRAGVPRAMQRRFDRACIEWIHAQSGGVPRLALRLGQSILTDQPEGVTASWRHNDDWLGGPLDELSPPERDVFG